MKIVNKIFIILTITLSIGLLFPTQVQAAPVEDDRTIFGETYTLESGRILDGNLNVIGGIVDIENDATVDGNVVVIGGLVTINGIVTGDLTVIGGTVNLEENAVIQGNLIAPASYINRDPEAVVQGDWIEEWSFPWGSYALPERIGTNPITPQIQVLNIANRVGRWLAFALIMTGLGALLLLIMPNSAEVMTGALEKQPWQMLGYGALTGFVMLFGGVILTITICLIPVAILLGLAFALAVLVGWLTLGYELGKRISKSLFKTTWNPLLSAAAGNILLYIIASGLDMIPCLGGFLVLLAALFGLGTVVVTLFGTRPYPPGTESRYKGQEILFENRSSDWKKETIDGELTTSIGDDLVPGHPIEELGLDDRINQILRGAGLTRIEQVLERLEIGDESLLTISGFDLEALEALKNGIKNSGFQVNGTED